MIKDQEPREIANDRSSLLQGGDPINKETSLKFSHYVFVFLLNLCLLLGLAIIGWYTFGRQYLVSIENRLSAAVAAKGNVRSLEVDELKNSIAQIRKDLYDLKSSLADLDQYRFDHAELQKRIEAIQVKIDQTKSIQTAKEAIESWKNSLITAIKMGLPLDDFRKNGKIPEAVREKIDGIDFIPTYKNISEEWNNIRDGVRMENNADTVSISVDDHWWESFKIFTKKIFRIQRLNEDNLTQEEIFVRHVDKLLVEREMEALLQWVGKYQSNFDTTTKQNVMTWSRKLEKFLQGQLILETVKKY